MNLKRVVIDIDGTICEELPTFEKSLAKPKSGAIEFVNKLYSNDVFVILYTARSWGEYKMTENWLKEHGFKYNLLMCGKPVYDVWIDDRAIKFDNWESINYQLGF